MSISAELLENLLRHCEIKRDAAIDWINQTENEMREFGEFEMAFWAQMVEALIELNAYRDVMSGKKVLKATQAESATLRDSFGAAIDSLPVQS